MAVVDGKLALKLVVGGGLLVYAAIVVRGPVAPAEPQAAQCRPADFSVANLAWRNEPDVQSIRVTGTLVNDCSMPANATVRFTFLDGAGQVISESGELWLAGTSQIPAKTPHQFLWSQHLIGNARNVNYEIVTVRH